MSKFFKAIFIIICGYDPTYHYIDDYRNVLISWFVSSINKMKARILPFSPFSLGITLCDAQGQVIPLRLLPSDDRRSAAGPCTAAPKLDRKVISWGEFSMKLTNR